MCQRVLRAYVLTCHCACLLKCSRANIHYVLTCSRANAPCILTYSRANVPWVLTCVTCHHALCAYVLTCQLALRAHVLTFLYVLNPLPHMACVTMGSSGNMLCLLNKYFWCHFFSVSLLLLLELYTLLLRLDNLINVFLQ